MLLPELCVSCSLLLTARRLLFLDFGSSLAFVCVNCVVVSTRAKAPCEREPHERLPVMQDGDIILEMGDGKWRWRLRGRETRLLPLDLEHVRRLEATGRGAAGARLQMHAERVVGLLQALDVLRRLRREVPQHGVLLLALLLLLVLDRDRALEQLALALQALELLVLRVRRLVQLLHFAAAVLKLHLFLHDELLVLGPVNYTHAQYQPS